MATVELVDLIQEEVTCPICLGFMKEPVSTDCGHCFCSSCISALLETSGTTPGETHPCPQCRTSFQPETLRHNRHLGNIVAALRLLGPGARPAETLCERHGESLRLFCQEDGKAVCALCDQSREHRGHRTLPVQVAARTYKVRNPAGEEKTPGEAVRAASQLQRTGIRTQVLLTFKLLLPEETLRILSFSSPHISETDGQAYGQRTDPWVDRDVAALSPEQSISAPWARPTAVPLSGSHLVTSLCLSPQKRLQETLDGLKEVQVRALQLETSERHKQAAWQEKVAARRQRVAAEFEKMRSFLEQEEQRQLRELEQEESETLRGLRESEARLVRQNRGLRELIAELESRCQAPPLELLQDVKDILSRGEAWTLCPPGIVPIEPRSVCRILGLRETLRTFAADVTLDPDTAHPKLVLSGDRRSVRCGQARQDVPETPQRFDRYVSVLGAQRFTEGRHYWEVAVGGKTRWTLGVCRDSVGRKGKAIRYPRTGYWRIILRNGGHYKARSSPPTLLCPREPPQRVGVFLDYEAGDVSFYSVADGSHIFTFAGCSFSGSLRPYFCPCPHDGGKNAAPLTICPLSGGDAGSDPADH
ncbi:E3 ubiquitin-protein ligase TRIM58-like [Ornithorhynchus anatinus]|uniref:E3 ubiquitin-protein ligase TRIM58-like n=1 Tax=Ornithorhynchus anatinus TaxID=9258 RepID=UPI0019D4592E|nr:E3 ubiquitin-protein ligase TRIM58-like [Ornithorhynchus anatinus]